MFYFTDHLNGNAISSVQFSASNPGSTTDIDNQVAIVNITVSNITLPVSRMTVTLSGLSASHLQDVAVLISSPTGINVLVLANQYLAGCNEQFGVGCDVNNVNYTFDQTANGTVAANNGISGTLLFILFKLPCFLLFRINSIIKICLHFKGTYRPSVANDTGRCSGSYLNSFPGLNFSITLDSFNYISGNIQKN
jgi:predicted small secreted protein